MRCFLLQKYENTTIYRAVYNVQPSQQTLQFLHFNLALVKQNENENKRQLLKNVCSVSHGGVNIELRMAMNEAWTLVSFSRNEVVHNLLSLVKLIPQSFTFSYL